MSTRLAAFKPVTRPGSPFTAGVAAVIPAWANASFGQRLVERAETLGGVATGGSGVPGFAGNSLRLNGGDERCNDSCFIRGRVFAVVGDDGSLCLRLPRNIAEDLIDNALGVQAGKNILTWPPQSDYQLETQWRILKQAYWNATGVPERRTRRLWSEWVVNH